MRRIMLLALFAVAGFALVPIASTATTTNLAYSDANGTLYLTTVAAGTAKTLYDAGGNAGVQALALAPNGKSVLVLDNDSTQLGLVPIAGGAPVAIKGTDGATSGGYSPDGASVVFATADGIYAIAATGGTAKKVAATPDGATDTLPVYAPSGKEIAFARDIFDADGNETITLELVPAAGGTVKDLATGLLADPASGGRISFSPNGKTIAFAGSFDSPGLFTVPAAGGAPTQLTTDTDLWPVYSPDGTKIFFSRDAYSPGADDQSSSPVSSSDNDLDELWSMTAAGENVAVIAQGDYEHLAVAGAKTTSTSTSSTTSKSTTTSTTTTTTTTTPTATRTITLSISGHRYTVGWTGTAAGWKVTLRVGKKTASVTVKGSVHSHVFIVTAKGAVTATVAATA